MFSIQHNGLQAKQARKHVKPRPAESIAHPLFSPLHDALGHLTGRQLCPQHQPFCISPLSLDKSVFSPPQQTGDYSLRNQSISRRQAPLTSYLVSRLLGLSGRGWDRGRWSHSAGLQTNPGRAGIGGAAGGDRAMEQPSCQGQRITKIVLTYLEVLLFS